LRHEGRKKPGAFTRFNLKSIKREKNEICYTTRRKEEQKGENGQIGGGTKRDGNALEEGKVLRTSTSD